MEWNELFIVCERWRVGFAGMVLGFVRWYIACIEVAFDSHISGKWRNSLGKTESGMFVNDRAIFWFLLSFFFPPPGHRLG